MNTTLQNLQSAIGVARQIETLQTKLAKLLRGSSFNGAQPIVRKRKRMSAATKEKLRAIQKKRWARYRKEQKQRA